MSLFNLSIHLIFLTILGILYLNKLFHFLLGQTDVISLLFQFLSSLINTLFIIYRNLIHFNIFLINHLVWILIQNFRLEFSFVWISIFHIFLLNSDFLVLIWWFRLQNNHLLRSPNLVWIYISQELCKLI